MSKSNTKEYYGLKYYIVANVVLQTADRYKYIILKKIYVEILWTTDYTEYVSQICKKLIIISYTITELREI